MAVTKISLADEQPTSDAKEQIKKRLLQREQSPSSRHQSFSYQFFQEQINTLGNPYDVTRIPISVLEQMQRDPMIGLGLHFINIPVMRARWHIQCERPDIAAFVDGALRKILASYILKRSQAHSFGFAPIVKRFQKEKPSWTYIDKEKGEEIKAWDNGPVEALTWKPFSVLPSNPSVVEPRWTESGDFNGIRYLSAANQVPFNFGGMSKQDENHQDIDVEHSLWITNEKYTVNESIWGYPRIGYAYRPWWSFWFQWALYDRFFERKADPPYVVYYPTNQDGDWTENESSGEKESMKSVALGMGDSARASGTIALPGDLEYAGMDKVSTKRQWEIAELEVKGNMDHFIESFEYLDVMKLRALWIPEQALMEGKGGTSSRNVASEEIGIHKEGSAALADEIDDELNRYVIPDLVYANFPDFDGEVKKVTTGFSDADRETMSTIIQTIGQNSPEELRNLDTRETLDRLGMPLVSQAELRRQEKEAEKALQESAPTVIDPEEGNAGVDEQGFYFKGRDILRLAEEDDFVTSLPKTKHYEDSAVVSQAQALRKRWATGLADYYEQFAKHINKANFDEAEKTADEIIDSFNYSDSKLKTLFGDSKDILKKVINRASSQEMRRANLSTDNKPSAEEVAEFLDDRGANYVKAIEETTREELKSFLAQAIRNNQTKEEIIAGFVEHFAEFPEYRARRIVRSEIRDAYNFATLLSGEKAGIKVVQAKDAQFGDTDADCIERNGRFFRISQALSETLKEHPNGTLEWVLIPGRDSVDVVQASELPDNDSVAYFDDEASTIYMKNDIPQSVEKNFLLSVGAALSEH